MVREIKNWKLREMLDKAGYNKVRLFKDNGVFYIEDYDYSSESLCDKLESQCIYVCHFCQMTVRQWADTIIQMLDEVKEK